MMARKRTRARRRRRRGDGTLLQILIPVALLIALAVVVVILTRPISGMHEATPTTPACPDVPTVMVGAIPVPAGPIAGYCQPELINAAEIMRAADAYTPVVRAKQIGVMTAIGESGLRNLSYGDTAGPDSRGLFQQRSNWGPLEDRMDPYTAAYNFYHRMFGVVGWNTLPPTVVAHDVQRNANPDYYTPYFSRASTLVNTLLAHEMLVPAVTVPAS